jgi:hypothetical protein
MRSFNWERTLTVARTDVKQLVLAKDFWMPMGILGSIFFVFVPLFLLLSITSLGDVPAVQNVANTLEVLPQAAQEQIQGDTPQGRTSYALAVFLFAPMAVVVPLTISTAVRIAARPVRFALRVWSRNKVPCSTVNSMSWASR